MFMVINKDKVVSYLISLSTVAMLFIFSFMVSKKNDEIIRTSSNAISGNNYQQINAVNESKQTSSISENNRQQTIAVNENNCQQTSSIVKNNTNIEETDSNFD